MENNILEGLNQEQIQAVKHEKGPLLIIAGAGTGKTTVITRRISWIIAQGLAKMDQILALTFTDKAAQGMQERLDVLLPYGYTDIWISTFHAFGDRLLRENALLAGLRPDFKVMTLPESAVFFREHLFEFNLSFFRPLSDPTRFIEALISLFSRARDEDISPREYLKFAQDFLLKAKASSDPAQEEEALAQMEIASCYAKYQELLLKEGFLDFSSQFYLALCLLRERPSVLKRYQEQFKYILVDEFQDTNFSQLEIIKLLGGENSNITVVADDDQCIYRWRGAAYSNVLNFVQQYPQASKVSLIKNYRSGQKILDSAYGLIQNNNPDRFEVKAGINKQLISVNNPGQAPAHLHFDTLSSEADAVARMIHEKACSGSYKYRDFAILVRSNSDADSFLKSLNMLGIPWQFSGNQGLYSREEIRLCINFLRVIANLNDSLNLYYLASSSIYLLDVAGLTICNSLAKRKNRSLYWILKNIQAIPELPDQLDAEFIQKAKDFLLSLEKFLLLSRNESTGRLLYSFLTDSGYLKQLVQNQSLENETNIQNLAKFFNIVREFETAAKIDRVVGFVNYLNLLIEAGDDPSTVEADFDTDAVNVLTVHKAKGLEFRVVFLVGLVQGRFPWPRRSRQPDLPDELIKEPLPSGDSHIQEERRLFYVGLTRAKEELYLTSAADYGGSRMRKISQFIPEALGEESKVNKKQKSDSLETIKRFAPQKGPIRKPLPIDKPYIGLSYYHIDDYLTCPLKYKYVNILRVPIMEHHTVIYGRAMHDALSFYFKARMEKQNIPLGDLLEVFRKSFMPEGFLEEKHQQQRLNCGLEALTKFYYDHQGKQVKIKFLEESFSFISGDAKISGRFDRVDEEDTGVVIIDFKTSRIKTQKDADKRVKNNLQLKLYALAYQAIFGVLPKTVELHFIESGLIGSSGIADGDLDEVKEKIAEVSQGIRNQKFPAKASFLDCSYCAYNQICPFARMKN
ncbi:MAG: exodeoxyribonuclease V subunit gamma [Candidatus Omnitrophica bacterium]|jgi:DNA helicase-2/ATP-dependent DNA helicase PcrA|nr:exodeoxyribonuclease V subunit gamma [Candidatus Omnitrophota bacterium]